MVGVIAGEVVGLDGGVVGVGVGEPVRPGICTTLMVMSDGFVGIVVPLDMLIVALITPCVPFMSL